MKKINICVWGAFLAILPWLHGCKKLIEIDPPKTSVTSESVFSTNEGAIAIVTGLYSSMGNDNASSISPMGLTMFAGLSSDELSIVDPTEIGTIPSVYTNQTRSSGSRLPNFWANFYGYIFRINVIIEGLEKASTFEESPLKSNLNGNVRKQLLGEAKFMRAFYYFYMVQLYGDVPLLLSPDYVTNSISPRANKEQVYQQIIRDLKEAEINLNSGYVDRSLTTSTATTPRLRPNKFVATALLARVYLYHGDFEPADEAANAVIQNTALYGLKSSLDDVFKASLTTSVNKEAIWQLQPVITGRNTQEGWLFILPSTGPDASTGSYPVFLNPRVLTAFETGDQRKTSWIRSMSTTNLTYYYPYKYKSGTLNAAVTEYSTVFRLAEQYLISAEAKARLGKITGVNSAETMLNTIRNRAGLGNTNAANQTDMLNAILHERQVELFAEWGHRWFDLKRSGTIDAVMRIVTPLKSGNNWDPNQALYPIPQTDIDKNKNLVQNPGY